MRFTQRARSGFFDFDGYIDAIPANAQPISCQFIDSDTVWTKKPFSQHTCTEKIPPPGELVHDTLKGPQISIKGGSDGSLYPDDRVMTAAWIIAEDEANFTSACTVIRNVSSLSSYRAELEGTFRLLRHIDWIGLTPAEVRHWCDNKGAIKANKLTAVQTPTGMLAPDADFILAIMDIKRKMSANIKCRYVASHQDEKKRKFKSSKQRCKERRGKRPEQLQRIQTVEIKGGTHAPLPEPIADEEDHHASDTSVESVRELGAEKHLSDKVQINVACDAYLAATLLRVKSNVQNRGHLDHLQL